VRPVSRPRMHRSLAAAASRARVRRGQRRPNCVKAVVATRVAADERGCGGGAGVRRSRCARILHRVVSREVCVGLDSDIDHLGLVADDFILSFPELRSSLPSLRTSLSLRRMVHSYAYVSAVGPEKQSSRPYRQHRTGRLRGKDETRVVAPEAPVGRTRPGQRAAAERRVLWFGRLRSNLAATLANGPLHTPASGQHWCHDASLSIADICKQ